MLKLPGSVALGIQETVPVINHEEERQVGKRLGIRLDRDIRRADGTCWSKNCKK